MSKYDNQKVLRDGLEAFISKQGRYYVLNGLKFVARKLAGEISSGKFNIPRYTGNLQDSIAVGLYDRGRLVSLSPTKQTAAEPQSIGASINGGVAEYGIWGSQKLAMALSQEVAQQVADGIYLIVFAAVPYAWYVNEFGAAQKGHHWGIAASASGGRGLGFYSDIQAALWEHVANYVLKTTKSKTIVLSSSMK